MNTTPTHVALATADQDLGILPLKEGVQNAVSEATKMGKRVTVRDPVSDKVLATVKPGSTEDDLPSFLRRDANNKVPGAAETKQEATTMNTQPAPARPKPEPKAKPKLRSKSEAAANLKRAKADNSFTAKIARGEVKLRKPVTKGKVKAKTAARTAVKGKTTKVKATAPRGMGGKLFAMAQRKQGATTEELNKTSDWKGAPWKWLFSNPKKTGWCDRFGGKLKVGEREGVTCYFVS